MSDVKGRVPATREKKIQKRGSKTRRNEKKNNYSTKCIFEQMNVCKKKKYIKIIKIKAKIKEREK